MEPLDKHDLKPLETFSERMKLQTKVSQRLVVGRCRPCAVHEKTEQIPMSRKAFWQKLLIQRNTTWQNLGKVVAARSSPRFVADGTI